MNGIADKFVRKFGLCVMCVSLFSGCATGTPSAGAISADDLLWFAPDCNQKHQQAVWLLSLRRTADDQLFSVAGLMGEGKRINRLVDAHLRYLRDYC